MGKTSRTPTSSFEFDVNAIRRSADENLPVAEFARTPLRSRPRRDSGESHYDPGKNSTAARLNPATLAVGPAAPRAGRYSGRWIGRQ
jgi:hypothetical protein